MPRTRSTSPSGSERSDSSGSYESSGSESCSGSGSGSRRSSSSNESHRDHRRTITSTQGHGYQAGFSLSLAIPAPQQTVEIITEERIETEIHHYHRDGSSSVRRIGAGDQPGGQQLQIEGNPEIEKLKQRVKEKTESDDRRIKRIEHSNEQEVRQLKKRITEMELRESEMQRHRDLQDAQDRAKNARHEKDLAETKEQLQKPQAKRETQHAIDVERSKAERNKESKEAEERQVAKKGLSAEEVQKLIDAARAKDKQEQPRPAAKSSHAITERSSTSTSPGHQIHGSPAPSKRDAVKHGRSSSSSGESKLNPTRQIAESKSNESSLHGNRSGEVARVSPHTHVNIRMGPSNANPGSRSTAVIDAGLANPSQALTRGPSTIPRSAEPLRNDAVARITHDRGRGNSIPQPASSRDLGRVKPSIPAKSAQPAANNPVARVQAAPHAVVPIPDPSRELVRMKPGITKSSSSSLPASPAVKDTTVARVKKQSPQSSNQKSSGGVFKSLKSAFTGSSVHGSQGNEIARRKK